MTAPRHLAARLRDLERQLDAVHGPTEAAFLGYGKVLAQAASALRKVGGELEGLTAQLSGDDTRMATGQLDDALRRVVALAARQGGNDALLGGLAGKADVVAAQMSMLRKTMGEVGVLAMNAKIQASHLSHSAVDFGVFTVEIARLGDLALATIDQTAARLVHLRQLIHNARVEGGDFERRTSAELATVHDRLQDGLQTMAARRDAAAQSTAEIARRSVAVAGRVAAAINEMQINDIAAQRIAHVSEALDILAGLLGAGEETPKREHQWLTDLPEDRRRALSGTVLRLQSVQLARTRDEFRERVGHLARHLEALAHDAHDVSALAVRTIAGSHGHGASFVGELERDMAAARDLLQQTEDARADVKRLTETTVASFSSMASDLGNIQSIDADMRVMGLNATFKCGRLGEQGRALGVIAHELRGCSKRTEELARRLSDALGQAMEMARSLTGMADDERTELSRAASRAMETSLHALDALGTGMDRTFSALRAEIDGVADALGTTAGTMDIGRHVATTLDRAIHEIEALAGEVDPQVSDPRDMRREVELLLQGSYTMDSERLVHDLFADNVDSPCMPAPVPQKAVMIDDLDSCFL